MNTTKSLMTICIYILRRIFKYATVTSLSCMRDISVVSSSVKFTVAYGSNAFSQEQKCSAKSGAFNSVVDAFVLLRMDINLIR